MLKKFIILLCFIAVFSHVSTAKKTDLFNGKNLNGWKIVNGEAEFVVENNQITGISKANTPNTFLVSEKKFTNFVLEFETKMDEGLNSGVQIRSKSLPDVMNGRVHGPQVECEDSQRGWAGGIYDEARKGWRYPVDYNPQAKTAFKKGQWNKFKVVAFENHIMTWINGVSVANLIEEDVETGFIGLQVHSIYNDEQIGKKVHWRNITIEEIDQKGFRKYGKNTAPQVSYMKNQLTTEEENDGWKLLWDGKTTAGWRGARLDHFPERGWEINDGILRVLASDGGESTNGGDIVTEKKYKNFIIELDFQITEGANSGIKYFVDTELNKGPGSSIGCEFQILDDNKHPDAKMGVNGNRTMGSLYDLIRANGKEFNPHLPREKYVNGFDQWNRARVVVDGDKVKHYLNGLKVVEYERNTQMWRALVAYSKYADWPNFGEYEYGNILLQDHGDDVRFKNIKIKELK